MDLRAKDLHKVDFRGVDLRGANLQATNLVATHFHDVDLRGANFHAANFGVGLNQAVIERVQIAGADFTGAMTSRELWSGFAAEDLDGVRCPNGTLADPASGCEGRLGHFPASYRRSFKRVNDNAACAAPYQRVFDMSPGGADGPLEVLDDLYVLVGNDRVVSRRAVIRIGDDGIWRYAKNRIKVREGTRHRTFERCNYWLIPQEPEPVDSPLRDAGRSGPGF